MADAVVPSKEGPPEPGPGSEPPSGAADHRPTPADDAAIRRAYDPDRQAPQGITRAIRVAGWVLGLGAVVMVPWTAYLAATLPTREIATHYDLAWTGFDIGLSLALVGTAVAALRGGRWLPAVAAATATMLTVDAWFDVVTAPDMDDRRVALLMAVCVEIPVAAACALMAVHAQALNDLRVARAARRRLPRRWAR